MDAIRRQLTELKADVDELRFQMSTLTTSVTALERRTETLEKAFGARVETQTQGSTGGTTVPKSTTRSSGK